MELEGKVALVTGAGRGIGRGIALQLAYAGADVGIADLDESTAQMVAEEIRSLGRRALALKVDVSQKQDVDNITQQVVAGLGRLDIMVNNAGVGSVDVFMELTEEEWERVMSINAKGVLFGIQAAARIMIDQKIDGRIINISSVAGKGGRPLMVAYGASKAAVINLTQSSALALADHQIRVNCLCPGVVNTELGNEALSRMKYCTDMEKAPGSQSQVPPAPLGPEATPEDIGRMVVHLAGKGGSYITGQAINIDGGRCMH